MGNWEVLWQPETIIGGDRMALGVSVGYISLSSPFLESKMEWLTRQIIKENENCGRHCSKTDDYRKNLVENCGEVF